MDQQTEKKGLLLRVLRGFIALILALISIPLSLQILSYVLFGCSFGGLGSGKTASDYKILDRFDVFVTNTIANAVEGVLAVEKIYMLSDSDQVAPEPNQAKFGKTSDPATLKQILDKTAVRLEDDTLFFTTETPILENSEVNYYFDDTIAAFTWKQPIRHVVYTFSEVKIEHPTQFRRFLADGEFGSSKQYLTSQMAASVNAVVASAGDFYKYRKNGVVVYNGQVERFHGTVLDNCFIDNKGDLLFMKAGELSTQEELENYVAANNVRFSLSFGPILIRDGERCEPSNYSIGEINDNFSRAAICQLGPLHYLLLTVNAEGRYTNYPSLHTVAEVLMEMGIKNAYTLDGGQTATIVMNDQVINRVNYGAERFISDIVYFATAHPD